MCGYSFEHFALLRPLGVSILPTLSIAVAAKALTNRRGTDAKLKEGFPNMG